MGTPLLLMITWEVLHEQRKSLFGVGGSHAAHSVRPCGGKAGSPIDIWKLARHRDGCARCRALTTDVALFTRLLREAPLLSSQRPVAVTDPRRARIKVGRRAAASLAFAALAAAAVLGFVLPTTTGQDQPVLSFQSVRQQQRFASMETRRLEPAVFVAPTPPVPSFAGRVLV